MPGSADRPRRVRLDPDGPLLVEGPVEVVDESGAVSVSRRFCVALCRCRRSRTYPWCDTSHRQRVKPAAETSSAEPAQKPETT
ncbi:CDGSH iron-sulfur domain-containing protein [Streptomyces sp. Da 82-17]|uniref:CDGSH iron-sulfur domain-containing protein n=1 Tax=Streptomyces sp. Da 82-17 TaxID=3377116 RepID=UPI0038D3E7EF